MGFGVGKLTQDVGDLYLSDVFTKPPASSAPATPPKVTLSAEQLARKAGLYRNPSTDTVGRIYIRDARLRPTPASNKGAAFWHPPPPPNPLSLSQLPFPANSSHPP